MAKFIPIILPQPGEDLRTWARQLTSQLQSLTAQLSSVLANIEVTEGGGGGTPPPGGTTTPVKTPDDVTILDVNGYYIDGLGRVVVDATGLHVYDLVGFQVIDGPNVYINTEHLVENAVKTAQLANDAVTYEKFFPDLVPIKIVDTLPNPVGYTGPGVVWLSTDRKLYRHTGTAWTSAVPAVDITGQLTNAQLESIAAAKLTGQIVETQIADDSISTPKLAAGSVSTAKLAAGAVVADTIAANAVTAVKLAAEAVEADKIAANAVTTSKLDALAVTAGKLAAGSVVAGKLAANAIVANDGVIGTAAIADAQIANLDANKITAGSIAAERMEANIVTALNGKFATLSALASSLGVVQILSGGALFTQGATSFASGTGVWMGQDGGAYKWRVGVPGGSRAEWTGTAFNIYDASGNLAISSGVVDWNNIKSRPDDPHNLCIKSSFEDGELGAWVGSVSVEVANTPWSSKALLTQDRDAFLDDWFSVTPGEKIEVEAALLASYSNHTLSVGIHVVDKLGADITWLAALSSAPGEAWAIKAGTVTVPDGASKARCWVQIGGASGFGSGYVTNLRYRRFTQITPSNVTTYIANAALGNAQIGGNLWSTNWNYVGGTGWLLDRSGNFYGNNIYARGDIEASSLKANTAMVQTLNIAGNAVIVPTYVEYPSAAAYNVYQSGTETEWTLLSDVVTVNVDCSALIFIGCNDSITSTVHTLSAGAGGRGHYNWPAGTEWASIRLYRNGSLVKRLAQWNVSSTVKGAGKHIGTYYAMERDCVFIDTLVIEVLLVAGTNTIDIRGWVRMADGDGGARRNSNAYMLIMGAQR